MLTNHIIGILIAALGGVAIGIEREHSGHATGPKAHFAGIRTFTLLGGLGGIAGWLWLSDMRAFAIVLLAAAAALVVAAYIAASRSDVDGTTEAAALIVLAAGVLAGAGSTRLASGIIAITALLLVEKSALHRLVARMNETGLQAGFRFAVMAIVVLPLLPEGPYGPMGGIRPRELWLLVLFFTGLNFVSYIARQLLGARKGYVLAGILGGAVSSTNVTLTFSRLSRAEMAMSSPLAAGVLAACTTMYPRVVIATSVLNPNLGLDVLPYLIPPFLVGCIILALNLRHLQAGEAPLDLPRNPLRFSTAIQMAILFQAVLYIVHFLLEIWGQRSMAFSGALLGLTDVDALILSMSRNVGGLGPLPVAAQAIAIGSLANTLLKLAIGLAIGRGRFRSIAVIGLTAIVFASIAVLIWWR
jgi:uncharacterized membrane protein (DUF4010 family)